MATKVSQKPINKEEKLARFNAHKDIIASKLDQEKKVVEIRNKEEMEDKQKEHENLAKVTIKKKHEAEAEFFVELKDNSKKEDEKYKGHKEHKEHKEEKVIPPLAPLKTPEDNEELDEDIEELKVAPVITERQVVFRDHVQRNLKSDTLIDEKYYKMFGLSSSKASQQDIQKVYKKLALKYHPDRAPNEEIREKHVKAMVAVIGIYNALKNPSAESIKDLKTLKEQGNISVLEDLLKYEGIKSENVSTKQQETSLSKADELLKSAEATSNKEANQNQRLLRWNNCEPEDNKQQQVVSMSSSGAETVKPSSKKSF